MDPRKLIILMVSGLAGCGYVLHGSTQNIHIDSVPTDAHILVDGRPFTTPIDLELARGSDHTVTSRTFYGAPVSSHIRSEIQWRYVVASFFLPPIIGTIVDGVTGGDCELVPSQVIMPLGNR